MEPNLGTSIISGRPILSSKLVNLGAFPANRQQLQGLNYSCLINLEIASYSGTQIIALPSHITQGVSKS